MGQPDLGDAAENGVNFFLVAGQIGGALCGDGIEFFRAVAGGGICVTELFEQHQRGVDHSGTWTVRTAEPFLDLLDDLVAVARTFGDQLQNDKTQIAVAEHPAMTPPASPAAAMPAVQAAQSKPAASTPATVMPFLVNSMHFQ